MDAQDFELLVSAVRDLAGRHAAARPDDLAAEGRAAAQRAVADMGLLELRRAGDTAISAQEAAIIAGALSERMVCSSFLGSGLLAGELLRLLGSSGSDVAEPGAATIAVGPSLGFVRKTGDGLLAWDCAGARYALAVDGGGNVSLHSLGEEVATNDLGRAVHRVDGEIDGLGRLAEADALRWRAYALTMVSAEMVGVARALVDSAVEYARQRVQYSRAIGSFQAVAHMLADAVVLVETGDSATRFAASALDSESGDAAWHASQVAKGYVSESAVSAVQTAMQVFGGIAQTWEHGAHLRLRRVLMDAQLLATAGQLQLEAAGWEIA
jgi:Acyl-CoA dehydrogenase, C-terminal domain